MTERLLSPRELAKLLGFTAGTVVNWAERGDVPAFKIGGRLRFCEDEVLEWLERRRLNGSRAGGDLLPTPTAPTRGVLSQVLPTPHGGGT
jgi:excisionase family DNA binding protein